MLISNIIRLCLEIFQLFPWLLECNNPALNISQLENTAANPFLFSFPGRIWSYSGWKTRRERQRNCDEIPHPRGKETPEKVVLKNAAGQLQARFLFYCLAVPVKITCKEQDQGLNSLNSGKLRGKPFWNCIVSNGISWLNKYWCTTPTFLAKTSMYRPSKRSWGNQT